VKEEESAAKKRKKTEKIDKSEKVDKFDKSDKVSLSKKVPRIEEPEADFEPIFKKPAVKIKSFFDTPLGDDSD